MENKQPEITIKQQKRKSLAMRVTPGGGVIVLIPKYVKPDSRIVKKFIRDGLEKLGDHIPEEQSEPLHTAEDIRAMVRYWAAQMGLEPGRIQMRTMYRKWGSCSSEGNITLNTAMYWLPRHLAEYVVIHELAHLKIFNHSPAFWALVGEYDGNYEIHRRELDNYNV